MPMDVDDPACRLNNCKGWQKRSFHCLPLPPSPDNGAPSIDHDQHKANCHKGEH
jgi:hypothetical protein